MVVFESGFWGSGLGLGFLGWGFLLIGFGACSVGHSGLLGVRALYMNIKKPGNKRFATTGTNVVVWCVYRMSSGNGEQHVRLPPIGFEQLNEETVKPLKKKKKKKHKLKHLGLAAQGFSTGSYEFVLSNKNCNILYIIAALYYCSSSTSYFDAILVFREFCSPRVRSAEDRGSGWWCRKNC